MKHFSRLIPILAGAVAVTGGWGMAAVGCGSSGGSNSPSDAGGMDATTDGLQEEAALSPDTAVGSDVNAASDADAGATVDGDAGTAPDADAGVAPQSDGGTDADASADADAVADAGIGETSIALTAQTFPGQVAAALCSTIATCCGTSGDAATFNWQSCVAAELSSGFKGSNIGESLFDGGNIAFNATQAQVCLNTIAAADCTSNQITSTEQVQLYLSCYAAYAGTLAAGSPCAATIECAPGNYCLPVDGGVGDAGAIGICQALAGVGGACGVLGANQTAGQSVCSYRGSASDGLFCQNISGDAGTTQTSSTTWTCQPQWAVGSDCYTNQDCASMICHQVGTTTAFACASAGDWANPSTCSTYAIVPDAGAD